MNRCHGLLGPQNGSDVPSALGLVEKWSGRLAVGIGHLRDVLASNWNFENKVCVVDYS